MQKTVKTCNQRWPVRQYFSVFCVITQLVESTENQAVSAHLCPVLSLYLLLRLKGVGQSVNTYEEYNYGIFFLKIDFFF